MPSGFPPVFDRQAQVLILGSMPSPRSREEGFYYMHPRNRFWSVLAAVLGTAVPEASAEARSAYVLRHRIALWDVLDSCDIMGAADHTIKNPIPNDLRRVTDICAIRAVFTTGGAAARLYRKFWGAQNMPPHLPLPSTSPANCRLSTEDLAMSYRRIADMLHEE